MLILLIYEYSMYIAALMVTKSSETIPFRFLLFWTDPLFYLRHKEALIVLMPLKSWLLCIKCIYHTATKIPFMYSQKRNCAAQYQFPHSCICERFIYSQNRSTYFPAAKYIGRPIVGIYKSLAETWMWKLGLTACNSFSGNICFEFLVLCLFSAEVFFSSISRFP